MRQNVTNEGEGMFKTMTSFMDNPIIHKMFKIRKEILYGRRERQLFSHEGHYPFERLILLLEICY